MNPADMNYDKKHKTLECAGECMRTQMLNICNAVGMTLQFYKDFKN